MSNMKNAIKYNLPHPILKNKNISIEKGTTLSLGYCTSCNNSHNRNVYEIRLTNLTFRLCMNCFKKMRRIIEENNK